ncbi:MAG: ABC transporter ATP-binding protein [Clostridia bacterium]|nr:ABC transporter ATP-binding protein [Clostridia bacterium]
MSEILRVENLKKVYKVYDSETTALDGVSFTVEKGEFVAVVGTSGSGKSTLLHILGGVDTPTFGRVIVDGEDIAGFSARRLAEYRRRRVSIIYQFYNLLPMLNVRSNVTLPLELDGRKCSDKELLSVLKSLGIEEKEFHYPSQMSGGEQQRAAIARALITSPAILLADEPTGNLDSKNTAEVMSLLAEANERDGQTIIMVTHDMDVAARAGRVIEMTDGKIFRDESKIRLGNL